MSFNKLVRQAAHDYIERDDMVALANKAFADVVPCYADNKQRISGALTPLTDRIVALEEKGNNVAVADQMAREIGWYRKYTADWPKAECLLGRLKALLDGEIEIPYGQDEGGSFGPGCTVPYRKLEPTVDELQIRRLDRLKPLTFMAPYQDPKWLLSELYRLQITDIKDKQVNYRDELGSLQSSLSQLMFKDGLRDAINATPRLKFKISPGMLDVYSDFLEQTQHPRTGFWGPWYRFDGELIRVQDLSFTFHTISYRAGDVARWPMIIDTTLDIENIEYPGGWYTDKKKGIKFSHHHNFDVAAIFAYGWPHIDTGRKRHVRDAIERMLTWCVTKAIEKDGGFKSAGGLLANTYYFGVRFLDKVGYWDPMKRFWGRDLPKFDDTPGAVAKRLQEVFAKVDDPSSEGETTRTILRMAAVSDNPAASQRRRPGIMQA